MKFLQRGVCRHFGVLLVYTYTTSLLLFSMPLRTEAMPTFLVETGKTKCYMVEAPVDTILRVDYEARGKSVQECLEGERCIRTFVLLLY